MLLSETKITYSAWLKLHGTLDNAEREKIRCEVQELESKPIVSLVVFFFEEIPPFFPRFTMSVLDQIYPFWELLVICPPIDRDNIQTAHLFQKDERIRILHPRHLSSVSLALTFAFEQAKGEFVGLVGAEDVLSEEALYEVIREFNRNSEAKLVYSDEDFIDEKGTRCLPVFKPDWSPELFLSQDYMGDLTIYQKKHLLETFGQDQWVEGAERYDIGLRFVAGIPPSQIVHIPKILYHSNMKGHPGFKRSFGKGDDPTSLLKFQPTASGLKVLQNHLDRVHIDGTAEIGESRSAYRIRYRLSSYPKVSIVIPTTCNPRILGACLESLLSQTDYPKFEIILAVNEVNYAASGKEGFLNGIIGDPKVRMLVYPNQPFNYSRLNNWAVNQSDGQILCLLNDDTEAISPDWLLEMASLACQEGVGAVGAKLYYPDGRIQHGGFVLGKGGGFHAFRFFSSGASGYMGRLRSVCNFSAVTGACLVVRRDLYDSVGGLDEEAFPVAFNDVDFCLKLVERGYRIVWTPYAELYHKEGISRGRDDTLLKEKRFKKELEIFENRWRTKMEDDPFYNPNLTIVSEDFSLISPPRQRASRHIEDKVGRMDQS